MFQQILAAIKAPGLDVTRDVVKCLRKLPAKPSPNLPQPILGTVLVQMRKEESRSLVMRNKHVLEQNNNETIRSLIIKNMKSKEQMFMENLGNIILKKIQAVKIPL